MSKIGHDAYRIMAAQSVAVGSGAANSTVILGSQTRYVRLLNNSGSTSPIWVSMDNASVGSTNGTQLAYAWPEIFKCNPGERVFCQTNSASAVLNVSEL